MYTSRCALAAGALVTRHKAAKREHIKILIRIPNLSRTLLLRIFRGFAMLRVAQHSRSTLTVKALPSRLGHPCKIPRDFSGIVFPMRV